MVGQLVLLWAWLPVAGLAIVEQAAGAEIGVIGQYLVPGSAAASLMVCVWLFIQRMAKAAEENSKTIATIVESQEKLVDAQDQRLRTLAEAHKESVDLLAAGLADNTSALREMGRWIRECGHHIGKDNP